MSGGSFNNQVIAVPEPETYATAILLLVGLGLYARRQYQGRRLMTTWTKFSKFPRVHAWIPAVAVLLMGMGGRDGNSKKIPATNPLPPC